MTLEELRETRTKRRLTKEERSAYCKHWESTGLTKRSFCRREKIAHGTFLSWLKGCENRESNAELFILISVIEGKHVVEHSNKELVLRLPNGLSISGLFSCNELPQWLKELSHALASVRG
jgi:hypothetical protein